MSSETVRRARPTAGTVTAAQYAELADAELAAFILARRLALELSPTRLRALLRSLDRDIEWAAGDAPSMLEAYSDARELLLGLVGAEVHDTSARRSQTLARVFGNRLRVDEVTA